MCHIDLSNKWLIFRSYFDSKQFSLKFFSQFCSKRRSHIARKVARPLGSVASLVNCLAFNVSRDAEQHLIGCHHKWETLCLSWRGLWLENETIGDAEETINPDSNIQFNPDSNIRHMQQGQLKMEVRESYRIAIEISSKPMLNCWGIFCLVVRIVVPSKITSKNVINN